MPTWGGDSGQFMSWSEGELQAAHKVTTSLVNGVLTATCAAGDLTVVVALSNLATIQANHLAALKIS